MQDKDGQRYAMEMLLEYYGDTILPECYENVVGIPKECFENAMRILV